MNAELIQLLDRPEDQRPIRVEHMLADALDDMREGWGDSAGR